MNDVTDQHAQQVAGHDHQCRASSSVDDHKAAKRPYQGKGGIGDRKRKQDVQGAGKVQRHVARDDKTSGGNAEQFGYQQTCGKSDTD